jgi:hypothetical protein
VIREADGFVNSVDAARTAGLSAVSFQAGLDRLILDRRACPRLAPRHQRVGDPQTAG